jgi:hypothetical protein
MRTKAQVKKEDLIRRFVQVRQSLLDAASLLPPAKQDEVFLGDWSVKDLLAHLVGWDHTNAEAVQAILAGALPAFYEHYDRDWRTFNAQLVAEHKRHDFTELLTSVENSHRELVELVETVPAEELSRDTGVRFRGYKVTIARTLEAEVKDEKVHHAQIEEFARRNS